MEEKKINQETKGLDAPLVMGSLIKPLEWDDNTKITHVYTVVSAAFVSLPTKGDWLAHIAITDEDRDGYDATLWCFNGGMSITNGSYCLTADDAKRKANEWWDNFVRGFLNCP
jgi:hypothetical protein